MTRISLCLIARDEERFLSDCLKSVRNVVDEIVVVDTGSRDRTRAIALEHGARVVDFAWCDDFSAARNRGIEAATGTHVLVLDADERLAGGADALIRAARNAHFVLGLLPIHDANALDARFEDVLAGSARMWEPCFVPRFFKRDPRIRFVRRVHETLCGDPRMMQAILRENGARIEPLDAPLVHLGEVPALRSERSKRARNTRLLEMALAADPDDGDLAGYLALELVRNGEAARARAIGESHLGPFLQRIEALPDDAPKPSPVPLAAVLATCLVQDGEPERAIDVVRATHARCIELHPNLKFIEGAALERLGRNAGAVRAFEACVSMHGRRFTIPVNPGATDAAPRVRLANLALVAGEPSVALDHLSRIRALTTAFELSATLLRAEALLQAGHAAEALTALGPLLARNDPPPDLFALAALAAERLGAPEPGFRAAAERFARNRWLETRRVELVAKR